MDSSKREPDSLNSVAIFAIGAVGALVVYTAVVGLQAYYRHTITQEEQRKAVVGADAELRSATAAQEQALAGYRWVDQEKQIATIPIERAMELVAAEAKTNTGKSLVPAVTPRHDVPTVPAVWGRPPDNAKPPAPAEPAATEPTPAADPKKDAKPAP